MTHAVVWIDHQEARIFTVEPENIGQSSVQAPGPHPHRHPKAQEVRVRNHPDDEHRFFQEVARAVTGQIDVLLVGPSKAKLRFLRHVRRHDHALETRIVGIETVDHPTDAQLVAHLRDYFGESSPRLGLAT
jgi:hypothetical protein